MTDTSEAGKTVALPGPAEVDAKVVEGVVVDDEPAVTRPPSVVQVVVVRPVQVIKVVVKHDHTKTIGRNLMFIPLGALVAVKRLWESRSTARYERMFRAAEAAGNHEAALDWETRRVQFMKDRHQRRTDLIENTQQVLKALPHIVLGLFILLAATGIFLAVGTKHIAELIAPFMAIAETVKWTVIAVSVSYGPVLLAAPWIAVGALWWLGRAHANANMTGWMVPRKSDDDTGLVVTADTIVLALQNLPNPALRRAFKEGWRPTFHTLPVRDGRGYAAVFSLPLGVTAGMVADQRPVLARNVHRAEVEVWPSDAEQAGTGPAGTVAMWIADPGVLSKAAPEYPLMHQGTADVFEGVPAGISPRGDEIMVPIVGNNMVAGGMMGQGKSNACRVIMLGCALDPLAELDVYVFANNGDFDAYAPRLARYVKGIEDDAIEAAVNRLHQLYAEVARREARLAELGAKKVTRSLAKSHRDLRPIVTLFSECHELFGHEEFGAVAAELATKTIKRARKTGITLLFDTQSSRKEAIPPKLVELVSVNACFYVKTWRSNDGFLGDGSFAAGIRSTELRPGRDRGTSVITGVSDGQFELLRWYFVEVDDDTGYDAAADVIARAVSKVAPGISIDSSAVAAIESRDLLGDLDQVLGDDRMKLRDAVGLLRKLAPAWSRYRSMTAKQLAADLAAEGVRTVNSSGTPWLDPAELRRVLAERDQPGG
jgi:DNA segregation ATPase FtsK/SpoIIIE, S-DNA-T family